MTMAATMSLILHNHSVHKADVTRSKLRDLVQNLSVCYKFSFEFFLYEKIELIRTLFCSVQETLKGKKEMKSIYIALLYSV